MALCDICNRPGMGTVVKARDMSEAVRRGFNPFKEGLAPDMMAVAGLGSSYEYWRSEAISGNLSLSDWNICDACYEKLRPYLPKRDGNFEPSVRIQSFQPIQTPVSKPPINNWALASFILSLLSLCGGILTGIPAIVTGFIALRKMDELEGQTRGKGLAWAGIVLGFITFALTTCLVLITLLSDVSAPTPIVIPPSTSTSTPAPTLPLTSKSSPSTARTAVAAAQLNDKIYIIGGTNLSGDTLGLVEEYDPLT